MTTISRTTRPVGSEQFSPRPIGHYLSRWARTQPAAPAHTFLDYLGDGGERTLTFAELDQWTRAVAALLSQTAVAGQRVAILAPTGPEYVVGFFAAMRAGLVAVPLFSPDLWGHGERLVQVLADCTPDVVITAGPQHDLVLDFLEGLGGEMPSVICADDVAGEAGAALAATFSDIEIDLDDIAYLQYTSGSTRVPRGVELTHANYVTNALQIGPAMELGPDVTGVSWLPLFHDLGLMTGAVAPAVYGVHSVLMDPLAFVMRPGRWIHKLGSYPRTRTAAPNFAYDLAAKRTTPEDLEGIDLSQVDILLNGAEPILAGTLERFNAAFGPHGMKTTAMSPSYGLAEVTVVAATIASIHEEPTLLTADVAELQQGRVTPASEGNPSTTMVLSGKPAGQLVIVVDPATHEVHPDRVIGEFWIHGPNVGRGYWGHPEATQETFGGRLADGHPDHLPQGPWMRSGDLGALIDGELLVTGRIKDLIIIDGRNVYPQDLEVSVQEADETVARNRLAAFSIDTEHGEQVVVVAERHRRVEDAGSRLGEVADLARAAVSAQHGLALADFVLVEPDSVPRTSSGKIARRATRTAYLDGTLPRVEDTSEQNP